MSGTKYQLEARSPLSSAELAEKRRMPLKHLIFLAIGGIIGSGWLLAPASVEHGSGNHAWEVWVIGGVLMAVPAVVMVELSVKAPKTGGLVFLPLQSSGALLATVIAASLWLFYASNPASEVTAIVRGIQQWWGLSGLVSCNGLTAPGMLTGAVLIAAIAAVSLLGPRKFLAINAGLTLIKLIVPFGLMIVLWRFPVSNAMNNLNDLVHQANVQGCPNVSEQPDYVHTVVTGAGVIYAYLGFQGPLDFAGSVRQLGRFSEAARMRLAVYATLAGSIIFYVLLQLTFQHFVTPEMLKKAPSLTYTELTQAVGPHWAAQIVYLDMLLSPAGAAMVFTYVLTREVAALSGAHLTHRGLQISRNSVLQVRGAWLRKLLGDRVEVYKRILFIDAVVSVVILMIFRGNWTNLSGFDGDLSLMAYATPGIVFAALRLKKPERFDRLKWFPFVGGALPFVLIAIVFYLTGWQNLWPSMIAIAAGCVVLLGLPFVAKRPIFARWSKWYDATDHVSRALQPERRPSALSAGTLLVFLAAVLLLSWIPQHLPSNPHWRVLVEGSGMAISAVLAVVVFAILLWFSNKHMEKENPNFPSPKRPGSESSASPQTE